MNITPSNSKLQTTFELPSPMDKEFSTTAFESRNFRSSLLPEDQIRKHDAHNPSNDSNFQQNLSPTARDQEIVDPKKQDVEIVDPKREFPEKEFPKQERNDKDQTPEKIVPKADKYFLIDVEGNIIEAPNRETEKPFFLDMLQKKVTQQLR
jgi:hypothetical protein